MPQMIGTVPVYMDNSGEVFVNPAEVGDVDGADDSDGAGRVYWPFGHRGADRRYERRHPADMAPAPRQVTSAELYQSAAANGTLLENQYNGLGAVAIAASSTGSIFDTINRNIWGKAWIFDSDASAFILVDSITIAGLPVQVGSKGMPLVAWSSTTTRHGISFGRKIALTGQAVVCNFTNSDPASVHSVSGGILCDELTPWAMQGIMEKLLLTAAVEYHGGM